MVSWDNIYFEDLNGRIYTSFRRTFFLFLSHYINLANIISSNHAPCHGHEMLKIFFFQIQSLNAVSCLTFTTKVEGTTLRKYERTERRLH